MELEAVNGMILKQHTPFFPLFLAVFAQTAMPSSASTLSISADNASVKELLRSVS
jgi:hypothetical protein